MERLGHAYNFSDRIALAHATDLAGLLSQITFNESPLRPQWFPHKNGPGQFAVVALFDDPILAMNASNALQRSGLLGEHMIYEAQPDQESRAQGKNPYWIIHVPAENVNQARLKSIVFRHTHTPQAGPVLN